MDLTGQLQDYRTLDKLHKQIHGEVAAGTRENTALLVQYSPTFTVGRNTKPEDVPNKDVPVIEVNRGGSVTWHGPGQLVCYPIVKLPQPLDVIRFIRAVEQVVIDTLEPYGIQAQRIKGRAGAWVLKPGETDNVNPTFSDFARIIPCGLADAWVTSMSEQGCSETVASMREPVIAGLQRNLDTPYFRGEENEREGEDVYTS